MQRAATAALTAMALAGSAGLTRRLVMIETLVGMICAPDGHGSPGRDETVGRFGHRRGLPPWWRSE
jgi:hypothetical protein